MSGMMYQPGDVLLIPFPFSDRQTSKKRPILLLTSPDEMGDLICLPITSSPHHTDGFRLLASHFCEGKLPKESWIRTAKVYTLNQSLLLGRFGALRSDVFRQVHHVLCRQLACGTVTG